MQQTDLIIIRAPSIYDPRELPVLHIPQGIKDASDSPTNIIGLLAAASQLEKEGRSVRIVDPASHMARSKCPYMDAFVRNLDAPFFAIELDEMMQARGALEFAGYIKKHHPKSRTIIYGCATARFQAELIRRPDVDFVVRGNFDASSAGQLLQAVKNGKFAKIPNLVWKDKRGRRHENELSVIASSTTLNVTEYYKNVTSQILRYRDCSGARILGNYLRHPEINIFNTNSAVQHLLLNSETSGEPAASIHYAFRAPEDVYRDIKEICRFSPAAVLIKGDMRLPGKHYAEHILSLLQHKPVANPLVFDLSDTASAFFIQEIARAAPGFCLNMVPGSHDEAVRKKQGRSYSNRDIESTIEAALKAGAGFVKIVFLVGLPGQTAKSVIDTLAYCEHLLRRFDGDRRLYLSIAPCLLPADCDFVSHENPGFKPLFHTLTEYLKASALPGWRYRLEYQTAEMPAEQLVEATYDALIRMVHLKAKYGQLAYRKAEDIAENYSRGKEMAGRLEKLIKDNLDGELLSLKPEIDRINAYTAGLPRRQGLPVMFSRPQNLAVLLKAIAHNSPRRP